MNVALGSPRLLLAIMPNPQKFEPEIMRLSGQLSQLRKDQASQLHQTLYSWGLAKHGMPASRVRQAIRKVRQNWP